MNKLEIINKTISEIRETLGAECANIEDLPDMIKQLATDPSKSGFTTAFVFSSESHPNAPTGGSLNTTTGLVVDIDESWSQGVEERVATFKTRSVSESSTNWMSFAVFGPSGERVTEWSTPINLKGAKGEQGIPGQIGAQGPIGPKGEKGDSANSYRTVSVYTTTETIDTPSKPNGGFWDLSTNTIIKPTSDSDKYEWFLNADEVKKNNYLWMSQATFEDTGELINDWCLPFRLTGEAGKNGADGRATEFIYRLVPDYETYKELKKALTINKLYSPEYEDDKVPAVNDDLNIGTIWTDQPKGITETMQVEVCCTRIRKNIDEPWSEWSNCIIWSKWGEDGLDGDGVEYIYLVTADKTNEGESIDKDYVLTYLTPNRKTALDNEYYQQDGFCFNGNWEYSGYDWSDEPKDVGPGKPLEWVMIRKKKKNNKGNVVWGEFSDPAIWGRFAEDGFPYLTSFVFTRAIDFPGQPTGGSYENPKPDQSIWSDSVPVISETMKGPVWMSTRVFYAGDVNAFDKDWTLPKIIADTHDFQVEYSKGNENGLVPHLDPFTGNEETWRAQQETNYGIKWGDDSQITDPTWMITSSCDNGVWKPWVLTRIKGERGPAGQSGTSVEIRGKFSTLEAIKKEWQSYIEGSHFNGSSILNGGDSYLVEENGMMYVYGGGYYPGEENVEFDTYWVGVQLTGEKGDSFYLYIAYCETLNEGATLYFDTPKKYIGTIVSDKPLEQDYLNKWSSYKNWTKWLGEDGWGQEQIFLLTSKNASYDPAIVGKKPLLPTNEEGKGNTKEYLPLHGLGDLAKGTDDQPDRWSDSPLAVSEEYPYCWVVSRSVPEFGAWKGDGAYASLYSRYSYDGKDGNSTVSVNLTNDLAVIPMDDNVIDHDFIANNIVTTSLQVFIGDDPVPSDRTTVSIEGGYATWDENTDVITLNFDKLPANVNEIPIIVTVDGGPEHTVTWKLFKTDTAYEISPDVHVIKRYAEGDKAGQLEIKSFDVKVKKWDGEKWIASNKAVFAEITTKEGKQWYSNQSNVVTETNGGIATINVNEIHDIELITVYLTNNDKNDGVWLSFEDIAIVVDGTVGPQGPQGPEGPQGPQGETGVFSDAEKEALLNEALRNIETSYYSKEYINKLKESLDQAIEDGDSKATADASAALETANSFNAELASLKSKFNTNEDGTLGTLNSSALNEVDIYNLSAAALGNDIADSEGTLHEDALFAKQIVGVISTFGSVKADNIVGDTITGKTIQSAVNTDTDGNIIEGSEGNAWKLESTGAGRLANGNITWDANGTVTFGSGVKLSWDSVKDAVEGNINLPEDLTILKIEGETNEYVYVGVYPIDGMQEFFSDSAGIWVLREHYDKNTSSDVNNYGYGTKFVLTENDQPANGDMCELVDGYYENSGFTIETSDGDKVVDSVQFVSSTGLTKSDVEDVILNTIIDGNSIQTGHIKVDMIDVDALTVKKLQTKEGSNGNISILDNDIVVRNKNSKNPVVTISGDSFNNILPVPKILQTSLSVPGNSQQYYKKVGTVDLGSGDYILRVSKENPYIQYTTNGESGDYSVYVYWQVVQANTSFTPNYTFTGGFYTDSLSVDSSIGQTMTHPLSTYTNLFCNSYDQAISTIEGNKTYDIYEVVRVVKQSDTTADLSAIKLSWDGNNEAVYYVTAAFNEPTHSYLKNNGILSITDGGFSFMKYTESEFEVRIGAYGIGVNAGDIWVTMPDTNGVLQKHGGISIDDDGTLKFTKITKY